MKLVFLDVDGVLNSQDWYFRVTNDPMENDVYHFDPVACARLQRLCEEEEASLVISSVWRLDHTLEELRALLGVTVPIIGRTPVLWPTGGVRNEAWEHAERGLQIQWWLRHFLPRTYKETRVVILDDSDDMGDLLPRLVRTNHEWGLTDADVEAAWVLLQEPLGDVPWTVDTLTTCDVGRKRPPIGPEEP